MPSLSFEEEEEIPIRNYYHIRKKVTMTKTFIATIDLGGVELAFYTTGTKIIIETVETSYPTSSPTSPPQGGAVETTTLRARPEGLPRWEDKPRASSV